MKRSLLLLGMLWGMEAMATPNAKELTQKAKQLEKLASTESDPNKAKELQTSACNTWQAAYDLENKVETLLPLGLCFTRYDLESAEKAFRLFLLTAPQSHKDYLLAQQALSQVLAKRQAQKDKIAPALVVTSPIPVEDSPKQWKKRVILAGGTLTVGLVVGIFALRSKEDTTNIDVIILENP